MKLRPSLLIFPLFFALCAGAQKSPAPANKSGDFVIKDFHFHSGEVLPELRLHYNTLGTPVRGEDGKVTKAVLIPTAHAAQENNISESLGILLLLTVHRGTLQPTNGSWSISQYKGNFYEVNALNRYVIAPWMPLKFNNDGSLDIYLQADSPGKGKESNWLPTPSGAFNITIRNYWPKEDALNGNYKNPPIKKVP